MSIDNKGLSRLAEKAAEFVRDEVEDAYESAAGESPIEKLFLTALLTISNIGASEFDYIDVIRPDNNVEVAKQRSTDRAALIVEPQKQLDGWRVDFLIHVLGRGPGGPIGWRCIIVECDGHDYHERTKEQATRDRRRDREWQAKGITVFRFTGAEIFRDAWACASQVSEWCVRSWL